jgi:hypothetical protein
MVDAVDVDLDNFFTWLDKHVDGGMANVWVALTGDHGVAPVASVATKIGMPAATFDARKLINALDARLSKRFSPDKPTKFILGGELPYIQLDPRPFSAAKVNEADAEQAVLDVLPEALESTLPPPPSGVSQTRLQPRPNIRRAYSRVQIALGMVPATDEGRLILHSYSANPGWYVMLTPGPFQMTYTSGTNHFTPYSYDRHVPLAFFGSVFIPGTYHNRVAPVDIAATFASLLRINQPSASIGHVLTVAIRNEPGTVTARPIPARPAKPAAASAGATAK